MGIERTRGYKEHRIQGYRDTGILRTEIQRTQRYRYTENTGIWR